MSSQGHRHKETPEEPGRPDVGTGTGSSSPDPALAGDGSAAALAEQVQKLLVEKQELTETLVRRQADFENYRKRVEKERHHDRHRGAEALIEHLLPVLDAFDRALTESADSAYLEYRKGFELIRRQLWETLAKQGLVRIDAVGQQFNPHFHHAIERVDTEEHAEGIVVGELQPGYTFHDKVLRPAMVRVAVREPKAARNS
ncbi:MAG TPA: nucleotide exchange factor GrpE [Candidatus Acidoferrales bacterium]|nr:nucleotide exchange factor GrpE [Candidatus Acidoferrales bacterium]